MSDTCDIAIIGGGAAGLAAAIQAAEARAQAGGKPRPGVVLLDGAARLGAKILVAGGGRCNVTHHAVTPDDYFTAGSNKVVRNILRSFTVQQTIDWFADMGVELKREPTGKLFPTTDKARTVLDALLGRCNKLGVTLLTDYRVSTIERLANQQSEISNQQFLITHPHGQLHAARVILATGGRSLPRSGSDGAGYELAQSLGHTVTHTHPALVPLVLDDTFFHADLAGVSAEVELACYVDGKLADRRTGAMLFAHFGITGPVAMDISRHWLAARDAGRDVELRASFRPGRSFEDVERGLIAAGEVQRDTSIGRLLAERLPQRLAAALAQHAGVLPGVQAGQLVRDKRRALVHTLTNLALPVTGGRGWNQAEVTAGGVPLDEIDYRTMGSRRCDGLYLVGEILDVDGRIGGFNFQWAWATGHVAGRAAAST